MLGQHQCFIHCAFWFGSMSWTTKGISGWRVYERDLRRGRGISRQYKTCWNVRVIKSKNLKGIGLITNFTILELCKMQIKQLSLILADGIGRRRGSSVQYDSLIYSTITVHGYFPGHLKYQILFLVRKRGFLASDLNVHIFNTVVANMNLLS